MNYLIFKRTKKGTKLKKNNSYSKKEKKVLNGLLETYNFDSIFEDISGYIINYNQDSFSIDFLPFHELIEVIMVNSSSLEIDSRFSILSDKEKMVLPEKLR